MILHTIVPIDYVFGNHSCQARPASRVIEWNDVKLEVFSIGEQGYRINRIISTNPFDYLDPRLQPGTVIQLEPRI